ncbi:MAG TPA: alcohol dehydrogenase catalytic domain-containing protein [Clostridia bacterium]
MNALKLVGPGNLVKEELPEPLQVPPEHALVEVKFISLCGSDYKLFKGAYSGPSIYPIYFGHEWSGNVIEINSKKGCLEKGDRVTGDCSRWCGECTLCSKDKNLCLNIEKFGISIDGFSKQRLVVPVKYMYKCPEELDYDVLALTECFSVALHAIKKLPPGILENKEMNILVIGGGPVGLAVFLLLKHYLGLLNVSIAEINEERRRMIKKVTGCTAIENLSAETSDNATYRGVLKDCRFDVVFEAAGRGETLQKAINVTVPDGYVVCIGMFPPHNIDFLPVVIKGLHLAGSIGGTGEFIDVLEFFKNNPHIPRSMISQTFDLENAPKAFEAYNNSGSAKVQIKLT